LTIEDRVRQALKGGPKTNAQLRLDLAGHYGNDRTFDRTLQRLRKQGTIKVIDRRRWVLVGVRVCTECDGKGWIEE